MKPGSRRQFIKTAGAASLAATILHYPANAAEFTYKFGNNVPYDYALNIRVREAASRIRQKTNGRFDLQVFPAGQLGTDTDMLSQVRSGALQFYTASGSVLSTAVPLAAINALGFAFKDYSQVWPAMDGQLGDLISARIETAGLHPIRKMFDIGFREVTSGTHPITDAASFKGFKIRVPPSQLSVSLFQALGAAPTTLNFAEVYTALQTHLVDGQENPLSIIETVKFYEVQKYVSLTNHQWDGFWMLANGPAWKKLPADVSAVVSDQLDEAALADRKDIAALNASLAAKLESQGLKANTPPTEDFRAALAKTRFYADWHKTFGDQAWQTLETYVGPLG